MITSVNTLTAGGTTSAPGTAPPSAQALSDRFLKLLVAQMKNQDPLNPLDNAAVTSQMAQINTVQGISQLNTTMASMLAQVQGAQAITLPGRTVLLDGNTLQLNADGARGGFKLSDPADRVTVEIRDAKGKVVREMTLGSQAAGMGTFAWDGRDGAGVAVPPGAYSFGVSAKTGAHAAIAVPTLAAVRVTGVSNTANGPRLMLEGAGTVAYADVQMIL